MEDDFTAQAQRFVRWFLCSHTLGLAFRGLCFWGVGCRCDIGVAFQAVASKLCFGDKSQLKWWLWWMGVCSERVEIIPNVWCGANSTLLKLI